MKPPFVLSPPAAADLIARIENNTAIAGVIGLGYVGLPLVIEMARSGIRTLGFDVSDDVVNGINAGRSHVLDVKEEDLAKYVADGLVTASTDAAELTSCDVLSICVPTPLSKTKDPDLRYIMAAAETVATVLRPGQLIILESTTFPGTTREVMLPILQRSGLAVGIDFFLCFSPERVDPGNTVWTTRNTPKVIGGVTPLCNTIGIAFYDRIFDTIVAVESVEAAELVKVYENTFRMINIALVNELAQVCERLNVDVWNVLEAAATKPFGFMKFVPGPGLGGHCIPLDPHYLAWKMRTLQYKTRMIEVASEINAAMPQFVVRKAADALNQLGLALAGSRVLILGVAYKRDIDDLRESPALEVMKLLQDKGADLAYHDPFCPTIRDDGYTDLRGLPLHSMPLTPRLLEAADLVLVVTDHTTVDYEFVSEHSSLILDTRGAMRAVHGRARIIGLSGTVESPGDLVSERRTWAAVEA
ncbi:nucleotide sugar dehydrogenase [soil metagenome]